MAKHIKSGEFVKPKSSFTLAIFREYCVKQSCIERSTSMLEVVNFVTFKTATMKFRAEMTKTYTHNAIYFAAAMFLSVSIGAISPVYADAALPVTVPKLKKKAPKVDAESTVEVDAQTEEEKTVVVRRRKDRIVPPRIRPSLNVDGEIIELARFDGHPYLANARNEASSTVDIDTTETSSVVLDQDQPKDSNVSVAADVESAAGADELAVLKAEIASLKAQLSSEKANTAKLTADLVRAQEKVSETENAQQDKSTPEKKADAVEEKKETSADAADVKADAAETSQLNAAQAEPAEGNDAALETSAKVEEPKADELKKAESGATEIKSADVEVKTPASAIVETKTADEVEQSSSGEEAQAEAKKLAQEEPAAKPEEKEVALAPSEPESSEEPQVSTAPDLDAANERLSEDGEVAVTDPALLLPFPRENPFPRVVPKVAKGPLYITLPPVNDTYNMFVLGDSLGSGLWQGLHQNFRGSVAPTIKIVKKAKANTGIVRSDRFDWMENIEKITNGGGFQIAVMMFGANDAQTIRLNGKRHHFRSPAWEQIYRQRIDRMVRALKRKKIAIYWVGLPNVRIPSLRKDYLHFNAIFKEKADEHGFHFVETWDVTNNASGEWQSFGKSVGGKKAVLRAKDGTHFTSSGYRVLAQFPENVLRPDVDQARANRLAKGL